MKGKHSFICHLYINIGDSPVALLHLILNRRHSCAECRHDALQFTLPHCQVTLSLRYLCCWISNLGSSLILWRFRKRLILDRVTLNGDQHHPLTDPEMHSFRLNCMMLLVFAVFCVVLFSTRVQAKMVPPNFSRWRLISDGSALFRKAPFVTEGLV